MFDQNIQVEFKQTEIGKLPKDWRVVKLRDLLEDGARNGIYKTKDFHGRGTKIVNMGELFAFPRLFSVTMRRVELTNSEKDRFLLEKGDLLFARRSLVAEGAGKCCIVCEINEPTTFESSIIRIRPKTNMIESHFLYYLFFSPLGRYLLGTIRRQVAVAGITGSDLVGLPIPLPPLDQQKNIAKLLCVLDEKIELNHRMNKTLEAMGQALFKRWFIDFEFPDKNSNPYKSSGGKMIDSELGKIPMGWDVKMIGKIAQVVGGSTPSTQNVSFWENGNINWATPKDLSSLESEVLIGTERCIAESGLREIGSGLLPVGTVLLSSRAPIGYLAIAEIPVAINQGFIGIICNSEAPNLYIKEWIKQNIDTIKGRANGTTFLEISKSNFRPIPIVIPPEMVMRKYLQAAQTFYNQVVSNLRETRHLTEIRDSLLPRLMSGRIRASGGGYERKEQ